MPLIAPSWFVPLLVPPVPNREATARITSPFGSVCPATGGATFGRDAFVPTTRRQSFVTMSDGHSALERLAQVATVVGEVRHDDPHALVFYGGDAIIGTAYYPAGNNGEADMQALAKLGVSSFVIGNHDLDGGYDHFVDLAKSSNLPFVVANWDITGSMAELQRQVTDPYSGEIAMGPAGKPMQEKAVQPYRVFTNPDTGLKTVSIGLSIDPKAYGCLDPRITYHPPAETLAKLLPQIKADPALKDALIVVQTHLGSDDAQKLEVEFADVVFLAAHDHKALDKPIKARVNGHLSAVTDTGSSYRTPGIFRADVGPEGTLADIDGGLVPITDAIPKDPAMVKYLAPVQAKVDAQFNTPIATLAAPILRRRLPEVGDSLLGDWVTDAIKQNVNVLMTAKGLPPCDIALVNTTGLRADFPKAGPVTLGDVYKVLPFENEIALVTLTAAQVQEMMDHSAHRAGDPISGVTAELSTAGAKNIKINGQPLGAQATYRVATMDFMVQTGGAGYKVLTRGTDVYDTEITLRDLMANTLKTRAPLVLPTDLNRLTYIAPKPQDGPPPPPPAAAGTSFVGTWQQQVKHHLGQDEAARPARVKP